MKDFSLRFVVFGLAAAGALALAGCGSSFSCGDKGKCSKDQTPTADEITACNAALSGACGSQFKDYESCYESNEVCASDGTSDFSNTNTKCSNQVGSLTSCCASNPNAAGCNGF